MKNILACLIGIILIACPAFGALSVIQHVHGNATDTGSTVTCTLSSTGSSRNIVVGTTYRLQNAAAVAVASVTDNQSNAYVQAPGSAASAGSSTATRLGMEIWYKLGAAAGVTTVTVTFSGLSGDNSAVPYYKSCFAVEVSGSATFDTAAKVDSATCVANVCTGASVTTATATGFTLAIVIADPIDQTPLSGNEFTAGGDLDSGGRSASASLISSTAAAHQPAWHTDAGNPAAGFTSSTASFKQ